jgi:hypothetical protein
MATENGLYNTNVTTTTGVVPNKSQECLKLLNLHLALYILTQKVLIFNICHIVRKIFEVQSIRSTWLVRPILFENQLNCREVRKADDDYYDSGDGDNNNNTKKFSISTCCALNCPLKYVTGVNAKKFHATSM